MVSRENVCGTDAAAKLTGRYLQRFSRMTADALLLDIHAMDEKALTLQHPEQSFTLRFDGWILGTEERTHAGACITRRLRPAPSNNQNKSVET